MPIDIDLARNMMLISVMIIAFLIIGTLVWWTKKQLQSNNGRGEFTGSMETDLRLTYKRYKELYPYSKITYEEYKLLQQKKAFKRSVSSQKIKRMVR